MNSNNPRALYYNILLDEKDYRALFMVGNMFQKNILEIIKKEGISSLLKSRIIHALDLMQKIIGEGHELFGCDDPDCECQKGKLSPRERK